MDHAIELRARSAPSLASHEVVEEVMGAAQAAATDISTLATRLEHLRLVHRARRIEEVLRVLYGRAEERSVAGMVPAGLLESIAGFTEELAALRARPAIAWAPDVEDVEVTVLRPRRDAESSRSAAHPRYW